ncbi:hypothetical protein RBWH47_00569 [Rhodopirellula baltica WH47]|uniref:Uncharacterized protein n=1 Tax=Rhodopirellula baltica WH47 TaxID=991778 RepID=F2B042_RHOBT|nr:hypothetical protein RBWH47_00569 [Rhodopirellula baltica WH47]
MRARIVAQKSHASALAFARQFADSAGIVLVDLWDDFESNGLLLFSVANHLEIKPNTVVALSQGWCLHRQHCCAGIETLVVRINETLHRLAHQQSKRSELVFRDPVHACCFSEGAIQKTSETGYTR